MNFEVGADGIERATDQVMALFPVAIEKHWREKFQKEGHFVPGMVDEHGFRREWDGPFVYVGTVFMDVRDAQGAVTSTRQVLRMLADTPQELRRVLSANIKESFFGWWQAQQLQTQTYELYRVYHDEHVEFCEWVKATIPDLQVTPSSSTATIAREAVNFLVSGAAKRMAMWAITDAQLGVNRAASERPLWKRILGWQ